MSKKHAKPRPKPPALARKRGKIPPVPRIRTSNNTKLTPQVIRHAYRLLSCGNAKSEVKAVLEKRYKIHWRSCEDAISEAKSMIVTASGKSEQEHKDDCYAFLRYVLGDDQISWLNKLRANGQLIKLLGIAGPIKVDLGGAIMHRGDLAHRIIQSGEEAAGFLEKLDDILAARNGAPPEPKP